jgi:DNA end-binding protein Ku
MPRSIWNGTVSIGAVHVPVKLYSATESKTVHFHEVHLEDGARIEHRRFCAKENKEVPYEEIVKGYEVASGEYVVLDKDEIKAAAGGTGHLIEVEHFVCTADIDPIFYEKSYFLGSGAKAEDAYRVLHEALERTGRAAVGRFTFHNREYVAVIRPFDKVLALHTLRFADELVPGNDIDVAEPSKGPGKREVDMARRLIDTLHERFKPDRHQDEYRQAVLDVIERKAKGEEIAPADEPEADDQDDLMAVLEASLGGARKGRR